MISQNAVPLRHALDLRRCEAGLSPRSASFFITYAVKINGLTHSRSIDFLVAEGYLSWLSNGSVDRRTEWVICLHDTEPITVGAINKSIQIIARQLQFKETDLSRIAPELEAMWLNKDEAFTSRVFVELDKVPDLMKISEFLKPPVH